jgi:hypothetical protein
MANIQFKTNKVLFKADKITFCAAHCTCGTGNGGGGGDPPDGCVKCKSTKPCFRLPCTPKTVRLAFSGITHTTPVNCSGSGSITLTGNINGQTYDCPQDPEDLCRWLIDNPSSSLTATVWTGANGTGSIIQTTTRLRIGAVWVDSGLAIVASMIFDPYTEWIIFLGNYTAGLDFPSPSFSVNGLATAVGCTSSQFGGGRIGTGGTVAVTVCPTITPVTPACSCVDGSQPLCLYVNGLNITRDCNKFDVYAGEYTFDYLRTSLYMTHTASCTWSTGSLQPANNKNGVSFDIVYNASGPMGCGFYGTLTGDHGVAGYYYSNRRTTVVGNFDLYQSVCPGLPGRLTVTSTTCVVAHECTGGGLGTWPSSVQVDIVDHDNPPGDRNITGTYTATYSAPDDFFIYSESRSWGVFHIFVWCEPTVWAADLVDDSFDKSPNPTYDRFMGGPHGGGPSPNPYTYVETRTAVGLDPVGATSCPLCTPAWSNAEVTIS